MAPFYGWDSTASRLQSHYEEALYFLPFKLPSVLFAQFKKREKHSWRSVTLGKDAGF